ncbi:nuclear transport factor 2 [Fennellomyces sp. T-0311]|nr:nuclear transport factor 2 [Fennellomyces sp. T-0311]
MADFNEVSKAFVKFYYDTFDSNRASLLPLYRDPSMLTFEGQQFRGAQAIVEKLASLPFSKVAHRVSTIDAQPSFNDGAILVSVTGQLLVDEEQNPQMFSQAFHLVPDNGQYWVYNDIFRLNYA